MSKVCPKCESKRWMPDLKLIGSDVMQARIPSFNDAAKRTVNIDAVSVCADCGYAELQVTQHSGAWEEWRRHNT